MNSYLFLSLIFAGTDGNILVWLWGGSQKGTPIFRLRINILETFILQSPTYIYSIPNTAFWYHKQQASFDVIKEPKAQDWASSAADYFLLEYIIYHRSRNSRQLIIKQKMNKSRLHFI